MLDRIDLQVEVDSVSYSDLTDTGFAESSECVRARVQAARRIQEKRFAGTGIHCNAQMTGEMIKRYCSLDETCAKLIKQAFDSLNMSARGYNRILKVARTVADIRKSENIQKEHLLLAISFRDLDRKYWSR